jgi:hypothetical protein
MQVSGIRSQDLGFFGMLAVVEADADEEMHRLKGHKELRRCCRQCSPTLHESFYTVSYLFHSRLAPGAFEATFKIAFQHLNLVVENGLCRLTILHISEANQAVLIHKSN